MSASGTVSGAANAAPVYRVNVVGAGKLPEATPLAATLRWMCEA